MTTKPSILMIGHGSLGRPLALALSHHYPVSCLVRSTPEQSDRYPYRFIKADLAQPDTLQFLQHQTFDLIVVVISPSAYRDEDYFKTYVQGMQHLVSPLQANPVKPQRLLFVSSTSVYHQNDGEWVDEGSPTQPSSFSGQRLLEAENLLYHSGLPTTCIRFSGIYGGNRTRLLQQALSSPEISSLPEDNAPLTNRIHETDCLGVLTHLVNLQMRNAPLQSLYLASDCQPATLNEVKAFIQQAAIQKGLAQHENVCFSASEKGISSVRRAGSKRCNNQRLLDSGYHFQFPDFKAGYQQMIDLLPLATLKAWMSIV
jgi:nucleoside-diphosphate-sugar epimerase